MSEPSSGTSTASPPGPPRSNGQPGAYDVLRNRDFILYLVGRFAASLGQQMLTVAVGWEIYRRTGSPQSLGLVGLTNMIPMFAFTLPAGHLADTCDRKRIIVSMTGVMALASLGLACVSTWHAPIAWMYACLFLAGTGRTFMWPASASFLRTLVERNHFPRAVAWSTGSFQLSSVVGPAVGGAILALTDLPASVYALNAVAAIFCLALLVFIRHRPAPPTREPMTLASLGAGFRFVFASRIILGIITLDMFAVLLGGATALLPVYAKDILHIGPAGLGLLQAALPVGSLASAMVIAHRPPMERSGRALLWAVTGFGLATILFGASRSFWLSFIALAVCGVTDQVSVVVRHTLVQLLTPDEKRGRVSAVNSLFIGTSNELGGFESGFVAEWFGPVFAVVSGGIGTILVVAAIAWYWPEIRRYGRLESESSSS